MRVSLHRDAKCIAALIIILAAALCAGVRPAAAVPSFGVQTSQPCSACHVGSFGPRLKATGRDFKLHAYASSDNKNHWVPFNVNARGSFTHTDADQKGGAADGFDENDNFAFDGLTLSYAGKIAGNVGAVARLSDNGIRQTWQWGGVDVRYAKETKWFGEDVVFGATLNNGPTRTDLWESALAGAPTASSGLARRPKAAPIAGSLSGIVAGAGVYTMWNDALYAEVGLYDGLNRDTLNTLGVDPLNGADSFDDLIPYGRIAYQREFDEGRHFAQIGAYALRAAVFPRDVEIAGSNKFLDVDVDAMYQWIADPASTTSDTVTARVAYLHERQDLDASRILSGTRRVDYLSTLRADVSYSPDATFTATLHLFQTQGTPDFKRWGTPRGQIDTSGWIAQLDYAPWGKPDSPADWINARVTLQYLAYDEFNGSSHNASDRNTFLIGLSIFGTTNQ